MGIPLVLILIGILFLLKNLGIITGSIWSILWPLLVIILGLSLLARKKRWRVFEQRFYKMFDSDNQTWK